MTSSPATVSMRAPLVLSAARVAPSSPVSALVGIDPVLCRPVHDATGIAEHHRIRHAVFVEEQGVFDGSDVDAADASLETVHVLARHSGRPAGTVRLYPTAPGEWVGDRLAVVAELRAARIGGPLVRFAVAMAGARGGQLMRAHVQVANERFFHRLGWRTDGPTEVYVGRPHVPMSIELALPGCPWLAGPTRP